MVIPGLLVFRQSQSNGENRKQHFRPAIFQGSNEARALEERQWLTVAVSKVRFGSTEDDIPRRKVSNHIRRTFFVNKSRLTCRMILDSVENDGPSSSAYLVLELMYSYSWTLDSQGLLKVGFLRISTDPPIFCHQ